MCIKAAAVRRHGYDNCKEWLRDPAHCYAGRAMRIFVHWNRPLHAGEATPSAGSYLDRNGHVVERLVLPASVWHNPYKVGADGTLSHVLEQYRCYLDRRLDTDPTLVDELRALGGQVLGCWCDDVAQCHTAVIIEAYKQRCGL